MQSIEVKIKKLDAELGRYKEQMSRLRAGPGKVCINICCSRDGRLFTTSVLCFEGCNRAACFTDSKAEKDVRIAASSDTTTNFQYGVYSVSYGKSAKHDGNRGRYEVSK